MSCATAPVFWARQQRLPLPLQRFVTARLEASLRDPGERSLLVWPTVLGAPRMRELHPGGIPEGELLAQAGRMLSALGESDPERAWRRALEAFPDTADRGTTGWVPQRIWDPLAATISLHCGVILLALTGQPVDARYRLASSVTLFNSALFREAQEALEGLWEQAEDDLKRGLQGLIFLAAGFYRQQHHDALGMTTLWRDALAALASFEGELATPWGNVDFADSLESAERRMEWLRALDAGAEMDGIWNLARPEWVVK